MNTWSRSARRQAARQKLDGEAARENGMGSSAGQDEVDRPSLFRAEFRFVDDPGTVVDDERPGTIVLAMGGSDKGLADDLNATTEGRSPGAVADQDGSEVSGNDGFVTGGMTVLVEQGTIASHKPGGRMELHWLEGRDRTMVEALWKYVLSKADFTKGVPEA